MLCKPISFHRGDSLNTTRRIDPEEAIDNLHITLFASRITIPDLSYKDTDYQGTNSLHPTQPIQQRIEPPPKDKRKTHKFSDKEQKEERYHTLLRCNTSLSLCGATRNRTGDTRIFSPLLYQLSYGTIISLSNSVAEATRFELVVRLPVRQFSKLLVSATHPHFPVAS